MDESETAAGTGHPILEGEGFSSKRLSKAQGGADFQLDITPYTMYNAITKHKRRSSNEEL